VPWADSISGDSGVAAASAITIRRAARTTPTSTTGEIAFDATFGAGGQAGQKAKARASARGRRSAGTGQQRLGCILLPGLEQNRCFDGQNRGVVDGPELNLFLAERFGGEPEDAHLVLALVGIISNKVLELGGRHAVRGLESPLGRLAGVEEVDELEEAFRVFVVVPVEAEVNKRPTKHAELGRVRRSGIKDGEEGGATIHLEEFGESA